jgi:hypothetical protein
MCRHGSLLRAFGSFSPETYRHNLRVSNQIAKAADDEEDLLKICFSLRLVLALGDERGCSCAPLPWFKRAGKSGPAIYNFVIPVTFTRANP